MVDTALILFIYLMLSAFLKHTINFNDSKKNNSIPTSNNKHSDTNTVYQSNQTRNAGNSPFKKKIHNKVQVNSPLHCY